MGSRSQPSQYAKKRTLRYSNADKTPRRAPSQGRTAPPRRVLARILKPELRKAVPVYSTDLAACQTSLAHCRPRLRQHKIKMQVLFHCGPRKLPEQTSDPRYRRGSMQGRNTTKSDRGTASPFDELSTLLHQPDSDAKPVIIVSVHGANELSSFAKLSREHGGSLPGAPV